MPAGGSFWSRTQELFPELKCTGKFTAVALAYLFKIKTDKQEAEAASGEECTGRHRPRWGALAKWGNDPDQAWGHVMPVT